MSVSGGVKFIQISDSHLFDMTDKRLIGVSTDASLQAIIAMAAEETEVAGILATGDLSQDASLESYHRFVEIVSTLNLPIYWIPGNHDNPAYFHQHETGFPLKSRSVIETGSWRILLLDSVVPGDDSGHLASSELDYIEKNVQDDGKHHLLVLHHQPIACGSAWLDTMQLDNSDDFMRLIGSKPSVRAIVYGHIHQDTQQEVAGVQVLSCPSTCFKFTPDSSDFSLDTRLPGFRVLTLLDDGSIKTEVKRLVDYDLNLESSVGGY